MQGQYFTPDIPLTNVSQEYRNDDISYIAEMVAPAVPVSKKLFNIYFYGKEGLKKAVDDTRTRFGKTKIVQRSISSKPFGPLRGHELMDGIDFDQDEMAEAPLDFEIDITNFLSDQMAITKEIAVSTLLSNTAVITQNQTLVGGAQWSDYGNSTPFEDIRHGTVYMRKFGLKPANVLILSYYGFSILQQHPDFIERVKYSTLGMLTKEMMLKLLEQFGIRDIIISDAVYDTAAEGLAAANDFIWGAHAWLGYITPKPGLRTVNGAYTFTLENGRYVDSWFDQSRKTKWIRNNDYYIPQVVGPEAFFFFQNAFASGL